MNEKLGPPFPIGIKVKKIIVLIVKGWTIQ